MDAFFADLSTQVQLMETDDFWIVTAILLVLCIGGAALAIWKLTKIRLIQDTPTSKIRSAAQGYVELEGHATLLPGDPVVSPLTGHRCAWWKYSVEEKRRGTGSDRNKTRWVTIESDTSHDLFEFQDDTGSCVVDPEGASVIPNESLTWYGNSRRPQHRPTSTRFFGFGQYRYKEQVIRLSSPLYALGWFRTKGGLSHDFDESEQVRTLLAQWKADQNSLLQRFDSDGDGNIDMQEWEQVRLAAIKQVRQSLLERAVEPDIHVLCRPPRRMRYILSTLPQDKLINRARWHLALGLIGFFGAGSASVFIATARGIL